MRSPDDIYADIDAAQWPLRSDPPMAAAERQKLLAGLWQELADAASRTPDVPGWACAAASEAAFAARDPIDRPQPSTALPTADEMLAQAAADLNRAHQALGDAADWLRSDWRGGALTPHQVAQRVRMREAVTGAQQAINGQEPVNDYDDTDGW